MHSMLFINDTFKMYVLYIHTCTTNSRCMYTKVKVHVVLPHPTFTTSNLPPAPPRLHVHVLSTP